MAGVSYATTAQDYKVDITDANHEYALVLPDGAKAIEFQCRDATDIRHSFVTGLVAGAAGAYQTLKAGAMYRKENLYLNRHTLYVAAGSAGKVLEARVWT